MSISYEKQLPALFLNNMSHKDFLDFLDLELENYKQACLNFWHIDSSKNPYFFILDILYKQHSLFGDLDYYFGNGKAQKVYENEVTKKLKTEKDVIKFLKSIGKAYDDGVKNHQKMMDYCKKNGYHIIQS